jgi:hypothetical protein
MDELIAFVTARLRECEVAAWRIHETSACAALDDLGSSTECDCGWPARVLREIAAKRAILGRHMPHQPAFGGPACNWCSEDVDDRPQIAKEPWPCPDVRSLAAVWSDHQDYRQEWA